MTYPAASAVSMPTSFAAGSLTTTADATHDRVVPLVRLAFYLYVASIPFEVPVRTIPLEIPTITGCVFLLATLMQPGVCFRALPKGFASFAVFFAVLIVSSLLNGFVHEVELIKDFFRLSQLMVLFWTGFNVMRDPRVATMAVAALAAASLARAVLQLVGLGVSATAGRLTVFGQNENYSAKIMSVGLLIFVGLTYGRAQSVIKPRFLVWPCIAIIGFAVVQTGSRGAMVALLAGVIWFLFAGVNLRQKLTNACMATAALLVILAIAFSTEIMRERWVRAYRKGDLAKREKIFPIFWNMFLERPAIGWGHFMNNKEAGRRLRLPRFRAIDAHNLPLTILTSTGVCGSIPFTICVLTLTATAWRSRHGPHGILPFVVIISVLVGNLTGSWLQSKLLWFSFTYAAGCGQHLWHRRTRMAQSAYTVDPLPSIENLVTRR